MKQAGAGRRRGFFGQRIVAKNPRNMFLICSPTLPAMVFTWAMLKVFNVLHPVGWDAFGLPAENYAIKIGLHPKESTEKNIANFTKQIKSLGFSYDWSREINTSDPS